MILDYERIDTFRRWNIYSTVKSKCEGNKVPKVKLSELVGVPRLFSKISLNRKARSKIKVPLFCLV